MALEFGIFDSIDLGRSAPGAVMHGRLEIAAHAEAIGFDRYHVTEHHGTALSVIPPSLFLAALSQRTSRMRIGTLVYVVPDHEPLRLAEDVATLDQLTRGRFDFGVGRGVSPFELEYFGVAAAESDAILRRSLAAILESYRTGAFTHPTEARPVANLPTLPVQTPHPPLWYASGTPATAARVGAEGHNLVARWEGGALPAIASEFWDAWRAAHGGEPEPRMGAAAGVYVGESDAGAMDRYLTAGHVYWERLTSLWHEHGVTGADHLYEPQDMLDKQNALVGSAATVRDRLAAMLESAEINYFELTTTFGDLSVEEAKASISRLGGVLDDLRGVAAGARMVG
ncbi:MAG: LLM class flavin-dependent oxidoreductase [Microbacteriaceae bacterium]|nr:LLM class flavin-dependent oxidoreductase [Microbacteriaceae bacterium]